MTNGDLGGARNGEDDVDDESVLGLIETFGLFLSKRRGLELGLGVSDSRIEDTFSESWGNEENSVSIS